MAGNPSVAVAQTLPLAGNVDANVEQHLQLIRAGAEEGAQLLVFPELSLTGYELELADQLAFSPDDLRLAPLTLEAKTRSVALIVGAPVRIGRSLHIGALLVPPEGSVEVYSKRHLGSFPTSAGPDGVIPPPEPSIFRPGRRSGLFQLGEWSVATAICKDISVPADVAEAVRGGARVYCASMFTIPADLHADSSILHDYAARHSLAVAFANYGGPTGGLDAGGSSAIWSDTGDLLVQLGPAGAGVAIATETNDGWQTRAAMLGC